MVRRKTDESRSEDPPEPRHVLWHHVRGLLELELGERRRRDDVRRHVAVFLAGWLLLLVESTDEGPSRGRPQRNAVQRCGRGRLIPEHVHLPLHAWHGRLLRGPRPGLWHLVPRAGTRPLRLGDAWRYCRGPSRRQRLNTTNRWPWPRCSQCQRHARYSKQHRTLLGSVKRC